MGMNFNFMTLVVYIALQPTVFRVLSQNEFVINPSLCPSVILVWLTGSQGHQIIYCVCIPDTL